MAQTVPVRDSEGEGVTMADLKLHLPKEPLDVVHDLRLLADRIERGEIEGTIITREADNSLTKWILELNFRPKI